MTNFKRFSIGIICGFYLCLLACQQEVSSDSVRQHTIQKIQTATVLAYHYRASWDTRINQSTYQDTAKILFAPLDNPVFDRGYHVKTSDQDFILDGKDHLRIQHADRTILRHDSLDLLEDQDYAWNLTFFNTTPFDFVKIDTFEKVSDTLLAGQSYYIYQSKTDRPSFVDSTKIITNEVYYYVHRPTHLITQVYKITSTQADTLQIIDQYFDNYRFNYSADTLQKIAFPQAESYQEMRLLDFEEERHLNTIKPGDTLNYRQYTNLQAQPLAVFGADSKNSLVFFSFIGCSPCEYAMKEMQANHYQINPKLKLYYSSPVNTPEALSAYLKKKEFPFPAFAQNAEMNQDFSVLSYPSFILIDPQGIVQKVMTGYDERQRALLFGKNAISNESAH